MNQENEVNPEPIPEEEGKNWDSQGMQVPMSPGSSIEQNSVSENKEVSLPKQIIGTIRSKIF